MSAAALVNAAASGAVAVRLARVALPWLACFIKGLPTGNVDLLLIQEHVHARRNLVRDIVAIGIAWAAVRVML